MVNIFLAYSSKDSDFVEEVVSNLYLPPDHYNLWYYHKDNAKIMTMGQILNKIDAMDIFILILSANSMSSPSVQKEIKAAVNSEKIKEICTIIIDDSISITQLDKVPTCSNNNIYLAKTSFYVVEIIKRRLAKY